MNMCQSCSRFPEVERGLNEDYFLQRNHIQSNSEGTVWEKLLINSSLEN